MVIILLYIGLCILLAKVNSDQVAAGKKVPYLLNGTIHVIVAISFAVLINWAYFIAILMTARIFFVSFLNYFCHLPFFYINPDPKLTDKLEQKLFKKNGVWPFLIALFLFGASAIYLILTKHLFA